MIPRPLQTARLGRRRRCVLRVFILRRRATALRLRNRDLAWKYGPTRDRLARALDRHGHLRGAAMAEGWKVGLSDDFKAHSRPYKLAAQHELFGKSG